MPSWVWGLVAGGTIAFIAIEVSCFIIWFKMVREFFDQEDL